MSSRCSKTTYFITQYFPVWEYGPNGHNVNFNTFVLVLPNIFNSLLFSSSLDFFNVQCELSDYVLVMYKQNQSKYDLCHCMTLTSPRNPKNEKKSREIFIVFFCFFLFFERWICLVCFNVFIPLKHNELGFMFHKNLE